MALVYNKRQNRVNVKDKSIVNLYFLISQQEFVFKQSYFYLYWYLGKPQQTKMLKYHTISLKSYKITIHISLQNVKYIANMFDALLKLKT